jgi:hypothetical protein
LLIFPKKVNTADVLGVDKVQTPEDSILAEAGHIEVAQDMVAGFEVDNIEGVAAIEEVAD